MKNFFLSLALMLVGTLAFANNDSNVQALDTELSSSSIENNYLFTSKINLITEITFDFSVTIEFTATINGTEVCWSKTFTGATKEEVAEKAAHYIVLLRHM